MDPVDQVEQILQQAGGRIAPVQTLYSRKVRFKGRPDAGGHGPVSAESPGPAGSEGLFAEAKLLPQQQVDFPDPAGLGPDLIDFLPDGASPCRLFPGHLDSGTALFEGLLQIPFEVRPGRFARERPQQQEEPEKAHPRPAP
jgi:hypothetical protein